MAEITIENVIDLQTEFINKKWNEMKSNLKLFFLLTLLGTVAQSINGQDGYREKIYIEVDYYFDELDYAFYQTFNAFLSGCWNQNIS